MKNDIDKEALGKLIRLLRIERNMNQKAFSQQMGVTPGTVSKWENGINLPDTPSLSALASFFHLSVDDIYHPVETLVQLGEKENVSNKKRKKGLKTNPRTAITIATLVAVLIIAVIKGINYIYCIHNLTRPVAQRYTIDADRGMLIEISCVQEGIPNLDLLTSFCESWITSLQKSNQITPDISGVKFSFYPNRQTALAWAKTASPICQEFTTEDVYYIIYPIQTPKLNRFPVSNERKVEYNFIYNNQIPPRSIIWKETIDDIQYAGVLNLYKEVSSNGKITAYYQGSLKSQ